MKKLYSTLASALVLAFAAATSGFCQVGSLYTSTTAAATYTAVLPDSIMASSFGGTIDDNNFTRVPLKFPFTFNGDVYTFITIASNGYISFGPSEADLSNFGGSAFVSSEATGIVLRTSDATKNNNIVACFNADLQAYDLPSSVLGIKWQGTAPNRSARVQWANYKRYGTNGDGDTLNFAVTIKEAGSIEVGFGKMVFGSAVDTLRTQVGLRGIGSTDVIAMSSRTGIANAVESSSANDAILIRRTNLAAGRNRIITFVPRPPASRDIAVAELRTGNALISGCARTAQEPLVVRIENRGLSAIDTASVSYSVNGGAAVNKQVVFAPALAAGASTEVVFDSAQGLDLRGIGPFSIRATANTREDGFARNNIKSITLKFVNRIRVDSTAIISDLSEAIDEGWRTASRNPLTSDTSLSVSTSFALNSQSIAIAPGLESQWFYRAGLVPAPNVSIGIKFDAALFAGGFFPTPVFDIGTDSLLIRISTDCGTSWKTIGSLSQADLASGRLFNDLSSFSMPIPLPANIGVFALAFVTTTNGDPSDQGHRFNLDNIRFFSGLDLAIRGISTTGTKLYGCAGSATEPLTLRLVNEGTLPIDTATVGYRVNGIARFEKRVTFANTLAPGASASVIFSGAEGLNLSQQTNLLIGAYIESNGDTDPANNTKSVRKEVYRPISITEMPRLGALDSMIREGYRTASGNPITADTSFVVQTAFPFATASIAFTVNKSVVNAREWLYRTQLYAPAGLVLRFKSAATIDLFGSDTVPATGLQDDTLKVMSSADCGATWRTLFKLSQVDFAAGRLDNTLREFEVPLVGGASTPVAIAFMYDNNGTKSAYDYRIHLDDIESVAEVDVSVRSVSEPIVGENRVLGYCQNEVFGLKMTVQNKGSRTITSLDAGYRYGNGPANTQSVTGLNLRQNDSVEIVIPAQLGIPVGQRGNLLLKAFVATTNDAINTNDTVSIPVTIGAARALPTPIVGGLTQMSAAGFYKTAGYAQLTTTNSSNISNSTTFGAATPTAAILIPNTQPVRSRVGILTPSYSFTRGAELRFRVAVTVASSGNPVTRLGSDSLLIVYRTVCGNWKLLKSYAQSDFLARTISNALSPIQIVNPGLLTTDSVQFGFVVSRGATQVSFGYRWHVAQVEVKDEVLSTGQKLVLPDFTLSPNPASNVLNISTGRNLGSAQYNILSANGQLVQTFTTGLTDFQLNLKSGLAAGFYILQVTTKEGSFQTKLAIK